MSPESNGYSYLPPEEQPPLEEKFFNPKNRDSEVFLEPMSKEEYDAWWNEQKQINHIQNLAGLNGIYHGTYYHHGIGQKRG